VCYPTRSRQFGGGYVGSGLRYHYPLLTDETCDPVIGGPMTQLPVYRLCSAGSLVNTCHCLSRYTTACRPRAVVGRQRLSKSTELTTASSQTAQISSTGEGMGSSRRPTLQEERLPYIYDDEAERQTGHRRRPSGL